jgi:DNA replication regulator DPB11
MAETALQMGAEHKLDLTSDVTHLIVGDSNTAKYKYVAREREDIKVVQLEWVEAVRQAWMQGDDFNLDATEHEYRHPTFAGLRICVTGFEDCELSELLRRLI